MSLKTIDQKLNFLQKQTPPGGESDFQIISDAMKQNPEENMHHLDYLIKLFSKKNLRRFPRLIETYQVSCENCEFTNILEISRVNYADAVWIRFECPDCNHKNISSQSVKKALTSI